MANWSRIGSSNLVRSALTFRRLSIGGKGRNIAPPGDFHHNSSYIWSYQPGRAEVMPVSTGCSVLAHGT